MLLQLAAALTLPFILTQSLVGGSLAFLTGGAAHAATIRAAVLLSFVGATLTVLLGITAFPVLRRHSQAAAIGFVVVCAGSATLDLVQAAHTLSMLAVSQAFVAAGAAEAERYQVVGVIVAAARRAAHTTQLVAIGAWLFVFYGSLLRFRLVPRVLAGIGLLGVVLQFSGVTLMMLLGQRAIGTLAMPLLPIQITVAIWLLVKGFDEHLPPPAGSASGS
ncbi:DUF4386 family protein [Hymenobacter jejuensis]|uniref:DUF4386 family protein n=1 Tax=Hymenobacter jejuensis TaxID=2502781 RepID=UPI001E48B2C1|nr:DUF4386 family protein [Hymenobacter jejuensis]